MKIQNFDPQNQQNKRTPKYCIIAQSYKYENSLNQQCVIFNFTVNPYANVTEDPVSTSASGNEDSTASVNHDTDLNLQTSTYSNTLYNIA